MNGRRSLERDLGTDNGHVGGGLAGVVGAAGRSAGLGAARPPVSRRIDAAGACFCVGLTLGRRSAHHHRLLVLVLVNMRPRPQRLRGRWLRQLWQRYALAQRAAQRRWRRVAMPVAARRRCYRACSRRRLAVAARELGPRLLQPCLDVAHAGNEPESASMQSWEALSGRGARR